MNYLIPISLLIPAVSGIFYIAVSFKDHVKDGRMIHREDHSTRRAIHLFAGISMILSVILVMAAAWCGESELHLFSMTSAISIDFKVDPMGRLFVTVISLVWLLTIFYSFIYMKHEGNEKRFFGFYLLVYSVLCALCFAGNLPTLYLFYELMTLTCLPLILHNGTHEAIIASLKYLFYSMCGAYLGLFGIFVLYPNCDSLTFTLGGTLNPELASAHTGLLLAAALCMIIGFGAKAGMIPLHSWLPTAHPVAPSPASAVLSSIIVKCGVLAIIRVVFYIFGADFLRGTWVQYTWMILALITVFMGSLLAFRESVFKKRLAYSTVSQVSYILFGLSLMTDAGVQGALLHVIFHAVIKCTLFLTAGIFLFETGKTKVEDYIGIGKQMPKTLGCYTIVSLGLIGIPPTSGFISKWYLASGALNSGISVFSWLGPVVLLLSALLTAGYLLPVTMKGYFPGKETMHPYAEVKEPHWMMLLPLVILAGLTMLMGILPGGLTDWTGHLAQMIL